MDNEVSGDCVEEAVLLVDVVDVVVMVVLSLVSFNGVKDLMRDCVYVATAALPWNHDGFGEVSGYFFTVEVELIMA